jgi:acyl-CoA dehydrogenase
MKKKINYLDFQVVRWERQYLASTGEGKPDRYPRMLDLAAWLKQNIPIDDSLAGCATGLVHGDYRIDNLIFHNTEVSNYH